MSGRKRCAFEGSKFDSAEFKQIDRYLVHVEVGTDTPVEPPHEAIKGRTLQRRGNPPKWRVTPIPFPEPARRIG